MPFILFSIQFYFTFLNYWWNNWWVIAPSICSLSFIFGLWVIREKPVFAPFCKKNRINCGLAFIDRATEQFGQRLYQVKIDHSEALRNSSLASFTGVNHGFHWDSLSWRSLFWGRDEIFQDEESLSALSHLVHVNQHCGKNQKGKLVLGVGGHSGFQIFATYFGFWIL